MSRSEERAAATHWTRCPSCELHGQDRSGDNLAISVFWQTDEHDQPAITGPYEKTLTAATLAKELEFHASELTFRVRVKEGSVEKTIELALKPADNTAQKFKATLGDRTEILSVEWTHRHLRKGRRIHPLRRGHRDVPKKGDRQARHPLGRQPAVGVRVAFLIDEAHRSQEGKMGAAIRKPFRDKTAQIDPNADAEEDLRDEEEEIARMIREHDRNQLFVAFTATPAPATVSLFGEPFDSYTEAEAIAEGYIVDVAASIISYKTLYNLHCHVVPKQDEEKLYPKGVVAKALKNVAFQDDGLIQ
jgi:hypothetical protein